MDKTAADQAAAPDAIATAATPEPSDGAAPQVAGAATQAPAQPSGPRESVFSKVGFCDNATGAIMGPCAKHKTYQPKTLATGSGTGTASQTREEQDDLNVQP